jgi:hypothetical protein
MREIEYKWFIIKQIDRPVSWIEDETFYIPLFSCWNKEDNSEWLNFYSFQDAIYFVDFLQKQKTNEESEHWPDSKTGWGNKLSNGWQD